jgi:putative peptide zinc metalloprotease protein
MLGHLLGAANLAPETGTYLTLRRHGRDAVAAYPRHARRLYVSYAVAAAALVLSAAAGSCAAVVWLFLH